MNYGLYLAAAGTLNHMRRQDIYTNNLTNLNTVGFRPDAVAVQQRLPQRLETGASVDPQLMLEQLGGAPHLGSTVISLDQGGLTPTPNDLDVAIDGDGFFAVRDGQDLRLTRDGRFTLDTAGNLVTTDDGLPVLDRSNRPIRLRRDEPVEITTRGDIMQAGKVRATLRLARAADPARLSKLGSNLLGYPDVAGAPQSTAARVCQRHLESSPVDPITTLNDIINASKAVTASLTMVRYHGLLMDQAINTFGRVV